MIFLKANNPSSNSLLYAFIPNRGSDFFEKFLNLASHRVNTQPRMNEMATKEQHEVSCSAWIGISPQGGDKPWRERSVLQWSCKLYIYSHRKIEVVHLVAYIGVSSFKVEWQRLQTNLSRENIIDVHSGGKWRCTQKKQQTTLVVQLGKIHACILYVSIYI